MAEVTTVTAHSYDHRRDLAHYLRTARRYLDAVEQLVAVDVDATQGERRSDTIQAIEHAQQLDLAAGQLLGYVVGLARFEHATWAEIGDVLDVTKQAASERFRHVATIPRRGDTLGTLTRFDDPVDEPPLCS